MSPLNLISVQYLPQPFQEYRTDDLLINQILSQFRQRPNTHANQFLRRRKNRLTNLFYHVRETLSGAGAPTVIRIPCDGIDSSLIESVNDLANPGGGTAAPLGNLAIGMASPREQYHSRM